MKTRQSTYGFEIAVLCVAGITGCGNGIVPSAAKSWNPFVAHAPVVEPQKPEKMPVPTAAQKADMQLTMIQTLERQGQLDLAIEAGEELEAKPKKRADVAHRLAVLYDKKGNVKQADKCYKLAVARAPKNAEILCDYGYSQYLRGNTAEAEKLLAQAIKYNPRLVRAHNNLALVMAHTNRPDAALAASSKAGCSEAQARVNLANALMWDRKLPEAESQLKLALKADPGSKPAGKALRQLQAFQSRSNVAAKPGLDNYAQASPPPGQVPMRPAGQSMPQPHPQQAMQPPMQNAMQPLPHAMQPPVQTVAHTQAPVQTTVLPAVQPSATPAPAVDGYVAIGTLDSDGSSQPCRTISFVEPMTKPEAEDLNSDRPESVDLLQNLRGLK